MLVFEHALPMNASNEGIVSSITYSYTVNLKNCDPRANSNLQARREFEVLHTFTGYGGLDAS